MDWRTTQVAPKQTHHLVNGAPLYKERFLQVLKYHEPGLAPALASDGAMHIDVSGKPAYASRFKRTFGFYEGLAAVAGSDGWHHIGVDGRAAYNTRYSWCGNVQQGRCTVRDDDNNYHHIKADGTSAYPARWRYAGDFRDGIAVVQAADGRHTHINSKGEFIHDQWFLDLDVFHKNFARARDVAGWTHVDTEGQPVYGRRFAAVEPFYNGQARVERFDGALEVIDEAGLPLAQLRPGLQSEFTALSADLVGFWRTQTISTAVELGVFEALPGSKESIARTCGLNPTQAQRLLRALSELHLVASVAGEWKATSRGRYLILEHPLTLADAALEYGQHFPRMWSKLPEVLREAASSYEPNVFREVAADAKRTTTHHRMLQSYALHDYPEVPAALRLQGDERLIDAGGGMGALAKMFSEEYPRLQITVLDRPEVIHLASAAELRRNIEFKAADLFHPWGVPADVVVLARILHDWNDEKALEILRQARVTMAPGGRLFVVEMLIAEGGVDGSLCDLHLLMVTGGSERTENQYRRLLARAGFAFVSTHQLSTLPSIIEGVAQ